jgi:ABC-type nitrate/sulfonate/bicarbonate transport system substrate-binding protein
MAPAMAKAKRSRARAAVVGLLIGSLLLSGVLEARTAQAAGVARRAVAVLTSDAQDLRLLAFWVALGSGEFAREGLDVHVTAVDSPAALRSAFASGAAPAALLAGNDYERLISDRVPFVLAANLLQNDPTEIVVRRDIFRRLGINERMPAAQRLAALRGVTLGVAVPDRGRLYQLFRSQGVDADIASLTVRKGGEQIAELEGGSLDAAYLATPYLEKALDHDAVVLLDVAGGDIPLFAERMIEALGVSSAFAKAQPADVRGLVRGIAKAEHTIRFDPAAATMAVIRALPNVERAHAARIVSLYGRAVPATPHVEAQLIKREAGFYPVGGEVLSLAGVDFSAYVVDPSLGAAATPSATGAPSSQRMLVLFGALALLIALLVVIADQREAPAGAGSRDETI